MDLHLHLVFQIFIGIIIGWLAGHIVQGKGMGLLMDLIVGAAGAFLGALGVHFFHLHVSGFWGAMGVSVVGASAFLIVIRLFRSK